MPDKVCIHRGSRRNTCCSMPDMYVCRALKQDCVESVYEKSKLLTQIDTEEAKNLLVCQLCDRYPVQ